MVKGHGRVRRQGESALMVFPRVFVFSSMTPHGVMRRFLNRLSIGPVPSAETQKEVGDRYHVSRKIKSQESGVCEFGHTDPPISSTVFSILAFPWIDIDFCTH